MHRKLRFRSGAETARFAAALAPLLRPGDTILLSGGLGAGKTHFARALIQSLLSVPEDVPSPTFTLIQTYETDSAEIWHADLYRLGDDEELLELGLVEAQETAVTLVEWPERWPDLPRRHLELNISMINRKTCFCLL